MKDPVVALTLEAFATAEFLPFAEDQFAARSKTLGFYENGVKNLLARKQLAKLPLDAITVADVAARRQKGWPRPA